MAMVRFGICGCGGISNLHAECLKKLEAEGIATLVAGAEIVKDRGAAWGRKWDVPVYPNLAEMLSNAEVDAVTVTTPSGMHGEHVIQSAEAKKHVLCEKPLDIKLIQADAAIAAARRNGVTLGGIFQQRFAAGPRKVKRAIEQGYFGDIVFVHAETPWYRDQDYYDSGDWRGTWALDGGVLGNQSPHMIDRMLWLGGDLEEVTSAKLLCGYHRDIEAETVAAVTVKLAGGAIGTITGTTLAYGGMPQRVLICGSEGSCSFVGDELTSFSTKRPFDQKELPQEKPDHAHRASDDGSADPLNIGAEGHLGNIRDFAVAIRDKREPAITAGEQRKVVRALNMIYSKANIRGFERTEG
jgi:UDP-N-acetyl-2-amino-2-deoxyglucuronate dehydrogenase